MVSEGGIPTGKLYSFSIRFKPRAVGRGAGAEMLISSILPLKHFDGRTDKAQSLQKSRQSTTTAENRILWIHWAFCFSNVRDRSYDEEFEKFRDQVCDFEESIVGLFEKMMNQFPNIISMMRMLKRWEALDLPCIDVPKTYLGLFQLFDEEVDYVNRVFEENKVQN